jgi:tRNA_anti-like
MKGSTLAVLGLGALAAVAACVDRLPDQDLRIVSATPAARLSADILWQEYRSDRDAAQRAYFGKAIVISGTATKVGTDAPGDRYIQFGQGEAAGIRANLLDDGAAELLARTTDVPRVTLKCFCDGLAGAEVVLRSCVRP